jgi:ATP-dependent protease Clp ATPase subunit
MARKEKPQIVNIESILNNSADKSKLIGFLDESVICKEKIADQQESIRAIRDEALQQIGLAPKLFNQLLAISYSNKPFEKQSEIHSLDAAIEVLFATND